MWTRWPFGPNRRRALQRLDDEIRDHIEVEVELNLARGMSPAEARRRARIAFGNVALVREDVRSVWSWAWVDQLGQDVRYAIRTLRKNRGFAAVAVMTLSLGIGANTAIFSLIDALLLRPLPVPDPAQLLQVSMTPDGARQSPLSDSLSYPVIRSLAEQRDIFSGVGGFSTFVFDIGPPENVRRTQGALVTGAFYETMGLAALAGRLLTREDDERDAPLVAVITDSYWERAFARDARIVGQRLFVNGRPATIVGVSPPRFTGAQVGWAADITLPVSAIVLVRPEFASLLGPGNIWLRVLARPRAGLSSSQAEAALTLRWPALSTAAIAPNFTAERSKGIASATFTLRSGATGWTNLRELFQRPLYVLMTLVGLVMLIACANIAGLLLARATVRQKEIAIRLAIGAERGRLVRQLLTESALVSVSSATIAIYLAQVLSRYLVNLLSTGPLQVTFDMRTTWQVFAFTVVLAAVTTLLFGLAPALQATARGPVDALRSVSANVLRGRLLATVVTAQVALCLILLVGAGLFIRTLQNLQRLDTGFEQDAVLLIDLNGQRPRTFYQDTLDVVRNLPGVVSASVASNTPLSGAGWSEKVLVRGQLQQREPSFIAVSPHYFETLRTPILRGRDFTATDEGPVARVAIVNETFARLYFPDQDPIGQHFSATVAPTPVDLEIVGLVRDVIGNDLRAAAPATVYVPHFQVQVMSQNFSTLQVRATGPTVALTDTIRRQLQPLMLGSPVEIRTLSAQVNAASVRERLVTSLASGLGVLALTLAAVGLYGLLAYTVSARMREIGVRVALGANPRSVVALVLGQGIRLVFGGILIGLAGAAALSWSVEGLLFGLTPLDPVTFVAVAGLLAAVALAASCIPARRATRLDPLVSLRAE